MGGKYSAQWWEKFANINSEALKRRDNLNRIDLSLENITSGTAPPVGEVEDIPPPVQQP
jgi:hypothetical protein